MLKINTVFTPEQQEMWLNTPLDGDDIAHIESYMNSFKENQEGEALIRAIKTIHYLRQNIETIINQLSELQRKLVFRENDF